MHPWGPWLSEHDLLTYSKRYPPAPISPPALTVSKFSKDKEKKVTTKYRLIICHKFFVMTLEGKANKIRYHPKLSKHYFFWGFFVCFDVCVPVSETMLSNYKQWIKAFNC